MGVSDTSLRECVRTYALEIDSVTYADEMTRLTCNGLTVSNGETFGYVGADISDVSGIGQFANLNQLNLQKSYLSDVTELGYLSNLTDLVLVDGNYGPDLSPLGNLTKLWRLDVRGMQTGNITWMATLSSARYVVLDAQGFDLDLTPFEELPNIETLFLTSSFDGIDQIAALPNLTTLGLGYHNIGDWSPLSSALNLQSFVNNSGAIFDLSQISELGNLRSIKVYNNAYDGLLDDLKRLLQASPRSVWQDPRCMTLVGSRDYQT